MTIDDRSIIEQILRADGYYPGDPQEAYSVWIYENSFGNMTHSLCMDLRAEVSLLNSPAVSNPELLWNRSGGLTAAGARFMEGR